jgi:hypothetical protein
MIEEEWLACNSPDEMLKTLKALGAVSRRKLLLFGHGCLSRLQDALGDPACAQALQTLARAADGLARREEIDVAQRAAMKWHFLGYSPRWIAALALRRALGHASAPAEYGQQLDRLELSAFYLVPGGAAIARSYAS